MISSCTPDDLIVFDSGKYLSAAVFESSQECGLGAAFNAMESFNLQLMQHAAMRPLFSFAVQDKNIG